MHQHIPRHALRCTLERWTGSPAAFLTARATFLRSVRTDCVLG